MDERLEARRAKIICTLGPSTQSDEDVTKLIEGGMNAARLNLSFGSIDDHARRIEQVRGLSKKLGRNVAIIADLPGPKVRLGKLATARVTLERGSSVRFVRDQGQVAEAGRLPVGRRFFHDDMIRGDRILLGDGIIELVITDVKKEDVGAEVINGGEVSQLTAVHVPGLPLRQGPVWEEDLPFLELAVKHAVDYVALTYVRDANDLLGVREHLEKLGRSVPIIAKIERSEAFARLDGILGRADAVMMRRGDLGAEIEMTRVPLVQKEVVRLANNRGVPVIIATQMLGSMIENPRPTRAEASDVFNAIADGVDGVMLSSETAIGKHPHRALDMMTRIVGEAERAHHDRLRVHELVSYPSPFPDAIARGAVKAAREASVSLIVCFTESGKSSGLMAKYRPQIPIWAFCPSEEIKRKTALLWGVEADLMESAVDVEEMIQRVDNRLLERSLAKRGDRIAIVFGAPVGEMGHTNSVRLHQVGRAD
ncbi:MAG: pyruvate kinase [Myxococcota bacterium]